MNLIVFDIDDTLTKSEYQHQLAYVNAMKQIGISKIDDNWRAYLHHTDSYILKINYEKHFKKPFDLGLIQDFEERMTELMLALPDVTEIPGAKNTIESLKSQSDYAICFATGSLLKPAINKLNQAHIHYNLPLVVGSNEIYEREGIVAEAIKRAKDFYGISEFKNIIAVGDGIWDLRAAKNLGIHFIGIGMKNIKDFEQHKIKYHIEDWSDFSLKRVEEILN